MKLPTEIVSKNKIRDFQICKLYLMENVTMEDIGVKFKITRNRVGQILFKNRRLLILDKNYEKIKRVNWLKRYISKAAPTKKDSADLMEQLRREIEDTDKFKIDNSTHTHYDLRNVVDKEQPLGNRIKDFASKLSEKNRG